MRSCSTMRLIGTTKSLTKRVFQVLQNLFLNSHTRAEECASRTCSALTNRDRLIALRLQSCAVPAWADGRAAHPAWPFRDDPSTF